MPWIEQCSCTITCYQNMLKNKLFCDAQHGFVPRRYCVTQLLFVMELWTQMLDSGDPVYAIYLDFRKVFDTVLHQRLLNKVKPYGIVGEWTYPSSVQKCQITYNADKSKHRIYGNATGTRCIRWVSVELQSTQIEKDLGGFVDDALKFREHVSHAENKASRLPGLIRTIFSCIDEHTLLQVFTYLVRPHLYPDYEKSYGP